jgi:prepilin-type processing-associated H-X9-DG protein
VKRHAFVLAELLVVLIVLALFAVVFQIPLGAARDKARQAECGSHLQQVIQAWRLYSEDYGGFVAPVSVKVHDTGQSWQDEATWPCLMQAYLDDPALKRVKPTTTSIALTAGGMLSCPSYPQAVGSHTPHFGMNHVAVRAADGGWDRLPEMPLPAQTLIFADTAAWYVAGPTWGLRYLDYRHAGGANVAFADGHLDWLPRAELEAAAKAWQGQAPWQPRPVASSAGPKKE